MKIAALTIVAQHPKGIDLHLRNLRWSIDGDFSHHIFTFEQYGFKHPGIHFTTVDQDPMLYHSFWRHEALDLVRTTDADVLVISEQDVMYITKLMPYIEKAYNTGTVIIDMEQYGHNIHKDGKEVYPRLWEGGMIVKADLIREAVLSGVGLADFAQNTEIRQLAAKNKDHYFFQHGGKKVYLHEMADMSITERFENFFEFTLYCFLHDIKTERALLSSHLPFPEGAHRNVPELYTQPITKELTDKLLTVSGYGPGSIPTTLFMYYMTGVCEDTHYVRGTWKKSAGWIKTRVRNLLPSAPEWMTPEELQKLLRVLNVMDPKLL